MKTLKAVGYFIGKWTWNGIIGVIFLALALTFALCKVVGGFGAKIAALVGLGPTFAVELVAALLEKATITIRDNCFIY